MSDCDDLILAYQNYMAALARDIHRTLPAHVDFDDLVGYGQVGLAEAAKRFDARYGVAFETFAYYRIRGAIFDGLRQMSGQPSGYAKLASAADTVLENAGQPRSSSQEEVTAHVERVARHIGVVHILAEVPESEVMPDEDGLTLGAESKDLHEQLFNAIALLDEADARIIRQYYFKGKTMTQCAAEQNRNKSTIARAHARAIQRLRTLLETCAREQQRAAG